MSQKAAREKLDALIKAKSCADRSVRLGELIESYIDSKKDAVKSPTLKNYEVVRRKIFTFFEPDTLVNSMTPKAVQDMLDVIVRQHSNSYAGKVFTMLRSAFQRAYRLGEITSMDVMNRVQVLRISKTVEEVESAREKYLTREELKDVIHKLRELSPTVADACELQARTGLRFGELAALREEDYEGKEIYVNGTLQYGLGGYKSPVRGTPKNVYSVRHVALDARSREIIEAHILGNKARRAWYPTKHNQDTDQYIFTTREGGPLDITFVNHMLKRIPCEKHLSTHIFRHTHISLLAEEGVPLKAIMQRVGHNDPKTTLAVYSHVSKELEQEVVKKLNMIK
jgi:integrase